MRGEPDDEQGVARFIEWTVTSKHFCSKIPRARGFWPEALQGDWRCRFSELDHSAKNQKGRPRAVHQPFRLIARGRGVPLPTTVDLISRCATARPLPPPEMQFGRGRISLRQNFR